jgi:DNA-binding response OmpR family regulator
MGVIFILDDEEDILFVLDYWLNSAGYKVYVFSHSKPMMELLGTCKPDIMLLDINLRGEDGREVCKTVRKEYNYTKPILHISASQNLYDHNFCADGFIAKPFDLNELTKVIDSYISSGALPQS